MKKILLRIIKFYRSKFSGDFNHAPKYELLLEKKLITCSKTNKLFVRIKSISRSLGTKLEVDEVLNNQYVIERLDRDSIKFLFYTVGLLEGLKQNDIYTISKLDPSDPQNIIVKNTITFNEENWNIYDAYNDKLYHKLDKESIIKFTEIYLSCKQNGILPLEKLRMVK
jgi:hypothetical protein